MEDTELTTSVRQPTINVNNFLDTKATIFGTARPAFDGTSIQPLLFGAAQVIFCRRRHQARRPPQAATIPGSPTPTTGPGTALVFEAAKPIAPIVAASTSNPTKFPLKFAVSISPAGACTVKCEFVAWGYPVGDTYVTRRRGGAFNPEKEAAEESHNWTRGHLGNGPREPRTADVCQIEGNCIRPGCRAQCQPRRRSKVDGKGVRRPHTRHGYRAATRWTPAINTEVVLIDHECVGVSGDRYSHAVQ